MTPTQFVNALERTFRPLLDRMGFVMTSPRISGRSYNIDFEGVDHAVSVSFEPGDDFLQVLVSPKGQRSLAAMDDPEVSPRLSDLCVRYMSSVTQADRDEVNQLLAAVEPRDPAQQRIVETARRLALVLPIYLRERRGKSNG